MTGPRDALHVISLGAGVQSSTMALMAARGEIGPMPNAAIFADTGWEPKKIYEWLEWLEKQLPFPVYRVSGGNLRTDLLNMSNTTNNLFITIPTYVLNPDGTKGMSRRQCTSEYKIKPVALKVRELMGLQKGARIGKDSLPTQLWMGISTDEIQRMKLSSNKFTEHRFPLIEKRMNRNDCIKWMERTQYPKPPKSACLGCPFSSNEQWRKLKDESPEEWADTVMVDAAIRKGSGRTKLDGELFLHRDLVPLDKADLSTAEDRGQYSFLDECEGMCGV